MSKRNNSHKRVQKEGKIRDQYVCQVCGSTNHVEGHHIIDYSYGGGANVDNIITLCHECHTLVHQGKIDITKF